MTRDAAGRFASLSDGRVGAVQNGAFQGMTQRMTVSTNEIVFIIERLTQASKYLKQIDTAELGLRMGTIQDLDNACKYLISCLPVLVEMGDE